MAHTCPDCQQTCYCNGDIDDIVMDTELSYMNCTCCLGVDADEPEAGELTELKEE